MLVIPRRFFIKNDLDSTAEPLAVACGCHGQVWLTSESALPILYCSSLMKRYEDFGALKLTVASAGYRERFCS